MSVKKIRLPSLADAFEESFDGWEQYLNKDTGRIIAVPESKGICDDPDEWEEIISMIEEGEQFVRLPNQKLDTNYTKHFKGVVPSADSKTP